VKRLTRANTIKVLMVVVGMVIWMSSCRNKVEQRASIESQSENDAHEPEKFSPDSFYGSWVQPIPNNEEIMQGFSLHTDGTAESVNMHTLLHKNWWIAGNNLFLVVESTGNGTSTVDTIKYEIIKADGRVMHLRNRNVVLTYRKQQ
jgi:hypothetical protein